MWLTWFPPSFSLFSPPLISHYYPLPLGCAPSSVDLFDFLAHHHHTSIRVPLPPSQTPFLLPTSHLLTCLFPFHPPFPYLSLRFSSPCPAAKTIPLLRVQGITLLWKCTSSPLIHPSSILHSSLLSQKAISQKEECQKTLHLSSWSSRQRRGLQVLGCYI